MAETINLKPAAVDLDTWTPTPSSTKWGLIDDWGTANQDADYIEAPLPSSPTSFDTYQVDALPGDSSDRVVRVVLALRLATTSNITNTVLYPRVRIGTINVDLAAIAMADDTGPASTWVYREVLVDLTSYRPGGGAWLLSDFGTGAGKASFGLACGYTFGGAQIPRITALEVRATKQPVGVLLPAVRRAASSLAWRGRKVPVLGRATVGSALGALELGDVVYVSDRLAPTPEGRGWGLGVDNAGLGVDEARAVQVRQLEDDLVAHTLTLDGLVLRGQAVLLHDSGRTIGGARTADGITRLHQGGVTDIFERSSKAYVEQPDGLVGEVLVDEPALDRFGRLHEGAAQNDVKWSAFQVGETVWTLAGGAAYGTDEQLFEPAVGGRYLSTPAGGSGQQSAIPLYASSWHALSFDYRTLTGATASVRIQRADTLEYWNSSTEAWQAGSVDNALPAAAIRARATLRVQKSGTPDRTMAITLLATGGTVRWWHAQSEKARKGKGWASSRMVSRGTAATRAHSYLETSNDDAARSWPGLDGTARLRFQPAFSAADADGGGPFTLWRVVYAGGDEAELRYFPPDSASSRLATFEHRRKVSGVWYTSGLEVDLVAGEVYRIALRWQGKFAGTPPVFSVWCEGQASAPAQPSIVTESASAVWRRGGADNADGTQAEGWIWDETVEPFALSDGELEEW